jgi:hypothetical protein
MRAAVLALALASAQPLAASDVVAVPELAFSDTSGELDDQTETHAARLELFAATLRRELEGADTLAVVTPVCDPAPCRPGRTPFGKMNAAAREAGARLLLVGGIHKVSTLIGNVELTLIDLETDQIVCGRVLSYRGDNDQAWTRAAAFAAEDMLDACFR